MHIRTPLTDDVVRQLHIGDAVEISGVIYTARDQAHKRLVAVIEQGEPLPFDVNGQIIYYAGPSPAPAGKATGAIGPTTSSRMDPFTAALLKAGVKGFIGKGPRSDEVKQALRQYNGVYFSAPGGIAALLASYIRKSEIIAYAELGPEAIYRLEAENFPVVVSIDAFGGDIFTEGRKRFNG